jgi:hypothetical protein
MSHRTFCLTEFYLFATAEIERTVMDMLQVAAPLIFLFVLSCPHYHVPPFSLTFGCPPPNSPAPSLPQRVLSVSVAHEQNLLAALSAASSSSAAAAAEAAAAFFSPPPSSSHTPATASPQSTIQATGTFPP